MIKKVSDLNSCLQTSSESHKQLSSEEQEQEALVQPSSKKNWCCVKVPAIFVQLCVCIIHNMYSADQGLIEGNCIKILPCKQWILLCKLLH